MSSQTALKLCGSRWGRMLVHLVLMRRDRRVAWHWAGIMRDLKAR